MACLHAMPWSPHWLQLTVQPLTVRVLCLARCFASWHQPGATGKGNHWGLLLQVERLNLVGGRRQNCAVSPPPPYGACMRGSSCLRSGGCMWLQSCSARSNRALRHTL